MSQRFFLRAAGVSALVYVGSLYVRSAFPTPKAPALSAEQRLAQWVPATHAERTEVFERLARRYDQLLGVREMGAVAVHRRQLIQHAKGKVLEVGVGTGRNFEELAHNTNVHSVLAVDDSPAMLAQAQKRYQRLLKGDDQHDHASESMDENAPLLSATVGEHEADEEDDALKSYFPAPKPIMPANTILPSATAKAASQAPPAAAPRGATAATPAPASSAAVTSLATPSAAAGPVGSFASASAASSLEPLTDLSVPPAPRTVGVPPVVSFARMDCERPMPLASGSFDTLVATFVLSGTADPLAALKEWARVVRLQPDARKVKKENQEQKTRDARNTFDVYDEDITHQEASAAAIKKVVDETLAQKGIRLTDEEAAAQLRVIDTGARVLRREGRILLLDHCLSPDPWVAKLQAYLSADMQRRWGLTNNRDLDALVKKAGLRVVSKTTWRAGTLVAYELGAQAAKQEGKRQKGKRRGKRGEDKEAQREADKMEH